MDYRRIYASLVSKNQQGEYLEKHHIVPRCLGGGDEPSNLVLLTPRAHFIAHWLLFKIYPSNIKIAQAFSIMRYGNKFHKRIFTSHGFHAAKKAHSIETSARMKERNPMRNKDFARKCALAKTGIKLPIHVKEKISKSKTGVVFGPRCDSFKLLAKGTEYHDPKTKQTIRFKTHLGQMPPEEWVKGRALKEKHIWVTDGFNNLRIKDGISMPNGFYRGRTLNKDSLGRVQKCQP